MTAGAGLPPDRSNRRWMGLVLLASVGLLGFLLGRVTGTLETATFAATVREETDAERQTRADEQEKAIRTSMDSLRAQLDAEKKRNAELEAAAKAREDTAALTAREKAEIVEQIASMGETPPPPARAPSETPVAPAAESPAPPRATPPERTLGPTAVTDAGQVKKVLDSLNALFAGIGGKETWRVTAAEAVDGDRLVGARLEGRTAAGEVARAYTAGEARFVLLSASRNLEVRLLDGEAIYKGERSVGFVDGRHTLALEVDPAPWRNSGHPLVQVR